jgi:hypothetical protein
MPIVYATKLTKLRPELETRAECIVRMDPAVQSTTLIPLTNGAANSRKQAEEKTFLFDKSFWSHDPSSAHYAEQESVYNSFASEFLAHNFDGFHTCIFAYGQTGSGKSYTMMGTKDNPGLIPRYCVDMFRRIDQEPEPNMTYNVHVSYFEIYNEQVYDLLARKSGKKNAGKELLKIRESTKEGIFVQGLNDETVKSFADIQRLMEIGDQNRTTAQTKMNETSSRSHAVFTITLKQIQHSLSDDTTVEKTARMRLVDLAGSERANKTEATGVRLREGGKINKSLTTLGRVIAALADPKRQALTAQLASSIVPGRSSPRPGSARGARPVLEMVPYRDSVLTWILKDCLGGNSKTAMVACISPSASDFDETLSTLRYADQAKRIKTCATANIDAVSAAQRDAQLHSMAETIRNLQLSVSQSTERKKEEIEALDSYQRQVENMSRLMEETRQVSDARIHALTAELETLRPKYEKQTEDIRVLRVHLNLVLNEMKNPIIIPPELALPVPTQDSNELERSYQKFDSPTLDNMDEVDKENIDSSVEHTAEYRKQPLRGNMPIPRSKKQKPTHEWYDELGAVEINSAAHDMLNELKLLRQKMSDDKARFIRNDYDLDKPKTTKTDMVLRPLGMQRIKAAT